MLDVELGELKGSLVTGRRGLDVLGAALEACDRPDSLENPNGSSEGEDGKNGASLDSAPGETVVHTGDTSGPDEKEVSPPSLCLLSEASVPAVTLSTLIVAGE